MKKLILITSCVVLLGATAFAQADTTRTQTPTTQQPTQSDQLKKGDDEFRGWTRVQAADVPTSLRTTFGEEKYKGWESGTVYMNEKGDTYALRTNSGTNSTPTVYYFDKNGKVSKKPNN